MRIFIYSLVLFVGFSSCAKNCEQEISSTKVVLVEKFSGVQCAYCPNGDERLTDIQKNYPNQVVAVNIHTGGFAEPLDASNFDFRTNDGLLMRSLFEISSYPKGMINRVKDEGDYGLSRQQWAQKVQEQLCEDPKVNITANSTYNETEKQVVVDVEVEDLGQNLAANPLAVTIFIVENEIIDAQLNPSGVVLDYEHNHILRDAITPHTGTEIHDGAVAFQRYTGTFSYNIYADWNLDNCKIIAFVHYTKDGDYEVLQTTITSLR